jgi:FkbM family methyltransferase
MKTKLLFKKIILLLRKKVKLFPISIILKTNKGNLQFEALSPVEVFRIKEYGDEKFFLDKFLKLIHTNDIIYDIGASVGLITVHAALFAREGTVIAFEPDMETMDRLKHNVSLNNFSNVIFINYAVSDNNGEVVLFTDGAAGKAPTLRKQINREGAPEKQLIVETRALDDEILNGNIPLPTVLKIDIEGAEELCLRGAKKLLSGQLGEKPRLIFLELHPEFLPSFGTTAELVHNFVLNHGYSIIWEQNRDAQIHYCYQSN